MSFASRIALIIALANVIASVATADEYVATVLYPLSKPGSLAAWEPSRQPMQAASGQVVGRGYGGPIGLNSHAILWTPSGVAIDLNPSGFFDSWTNSTDGSQQVGYGRSNSLGFGVYPHAVRWSGTAASAVDLHPTGWDESGALGVGGNQQVGYAYTGGGNFSNAMLWTGTALSAVNLHPNLLSSDYRSTVAVATNGAQQVGYGDVSNRNHALLWSGIAASVVDLSGSYVDTRAVAIGGLQQVGDGRGTSAGDEFHALLWTGTAASVVDLHPTQFPSISESHAEGTNGANQVGWGYENSTGIIDALLWSGTSGSAVNLGSLLPPIINWRESRANSIDANGNIFGIADGFDDEGSYVQFAVKWSSVPEPHAALLLAFCAPVIFFPRRRRELNS